MTNNHSYGKDLKAFDLKTDAFFRASIHLLNEVPLKIFEERRPYESLTDHALKYRLSNYRNETTSLFTKSNQDIQEVLNESEIYIKTESESLKKWVAEFSKWQDLKHYDFNKYFYDYILSTKLVDANSVLFPLPIIEGGKFNANESFIPLEGKKISVELMVFKCVDILTQTDTEIKIRGGKWAINSKDGVIYKDFYFILKDKDLFIEKPTLDEYEIIPYYKYPTLVNPIVCLGKNLAERNGHKYFVSEYFGSLQIADKYVGIDSDLTVINSRSHPIKYAFKQNCTQLGCSYSMEHKRFGLLDFDGQWSLCGTCNGTGEVNADTSPFTTIKIAKKEGMNDESIETKNPIGFVAPPVEILTYNKDLSNELYQRLANSLCVNVSQNITNQSAESKSYDISQKVTLISNICDDLIRIERQALFFIGCILENKSSISIEMVTPTNWDVKANTDLLNELSQAKLANYPYFVLLKIIKQILNKQYKDNPFKDDIINLLVKKDKLIAYGLADIGSARAVFGEDISQKDIAIHNYGEMIIEQISNEKMLNENLDFEVEFDKRIANYYTEIPTILTDGND